MSVNLHILKASGRLVKYEDLLRETTEDVLRDVEARIELPDVDIVLQDSPSGAIPGNPTGGDCYEPHLVRVSIDPTFEDFDERIVDDLRSTLTHELHHAARSATVGFGNTLRGALISEGLTAHFDIEVNGGDPKPWDIKVQGEELAEMKELAQEDLDNEEYNHAEWFFGSRHRGILQWTGYSLAFALVGDYLKESGKTAGELVDVPAEDIPII